ncbi:putative wrky transcription factor 70 [Quercus suber]|uniref:Wrky transcription factor 70 n=1 Tax=Quercus suber TaxID=58331 RepID=A0AAW0L6K7_QUESU
MECTWPESLPSSKKKAIKELVQGRDFVNQLRSLLNKSAGDNNNNNNNKAAPAEDLVVKILNSFTNSLSILNNAESDEVSQIQANTHVTNWNGGPKSSESSEETSRNTTHKDRRGCYKRRKTAQSWTKETPSLTDDGYAWRKYGQKVILNAKFPRHYYRCTHKHDQGCLATKHVQRIDDDPPKYRSTYIGQHTCSNFLKVPELFLNSSPPSDSSVLLSFDNSTITNKQDSPFFTSFQSSIKQEYKEEIPSDQNDIAHIQSSSSDYLISPDRTVAFESLGHMPVLSSTLDCDNGM